MATIQLRGILGLPIPGICSISPLCKGVQLGLNISDAVPEAKYAALPVCFTILRPESAHIF